MQGQEARGQPGTASPAQDPAPTRTVPSRLSWRAALKVAFRRPDCRDASLCPAEDKGKSGLLYYSVSKQQAGQREKGSQSVRVGETYTQRMKTESSPPELGRGGDAEGRGGRDEGRGRRKMGRAGERRRERDSWGGEELEKRSRRRRKTERRRQRDRQRDRGTDRGTETDRDRDRGTEAETEGQRQRKDSRSCFPWFLLRSPPQLPHVSCLSPSTPLSPGPSSPPLLGRLCRTGPSHSHPRACLAGSSPGGSAGGDSGHHHPPGERPDTRALLPQLPQVLSLCLQHIPRVCFHPSNQQYSPGSAGLWAPVPPSAMGSHKVPRSRLHHKPDVATGDSPPTPGPGIQGRLFPRQALLLQSPRPFLLLLPLPGMTSPTAHHPSRPSQGSL